MPGACSTICGAIRSAIGRGAAGPAGGRRAAAAGSPAGAALRQAPDNGRPFVYRIDGKTLNVAPVSVGVVDEQQGIVQVTDGLSAGDKVVVGNVGTLGRGMQVTIAGTERQQVRRP